MASRFSEISSEFLKEVIGSSFYMVDVLVKLGFQRNNGSMVKIILKRCLVENISVAHFIGRKGRKTPRKPIFSLDDVLIENSNYRNNGRLKIRLFKIGLLECKCYECGIGSFWNGKPLSLHLDHKNGIYNDNRICNLRILFPNCHSQTETYSGRNMKGARIKLNKKVEIKKDKVVKLNKTKEELAEIRFNMRKVKNRPSYDDLIKLIKENNYVKVGKMYGVSDNAIRIWVKDYEKQNN